MHVPERQLADVRTYYDLDSDRPGRIAATTLAAHVGGDHSPPLHYTGHPSSADDDSTRSLSADTSRDSSTDSGSAVARQPSALRTQCLPQRNASTANATVAASDSEGTVDEGEYVQQARSGRELGGAAEVGGSSTRPSRTQGGHPALQWRGVPTISGVLRVS